MVKKAAIDPKAVEREILKVTQLEAVKGEKRADYLARIARVLADMDGDEWMKLSPAAKVWSNQAITATREKETAADFGDLDYSEEIAKAWEAGEGEAGEAPGAAEADETGDQKEMKGKDSKSTKAAKPSKKAAKPSKAAKSKKAAKPEKAAKSKKAAKPSKKAKASNRPRADGGMQVKNGRMVGTKVEIKRMLLKKLDSSVDDIRAGLKKLGITPNDWTIRIVRADLRNTVKLMQELGYQV